MKTNRNKSIMAWIFSVLMLVTLMPSMAFADSTDNGAKSLQWSYTSPKISSKLGTNGCAFLAGEGAYADDIVVESSDESVIPSELTWIATRTAGSALNVNFYPLKEGTTTLVARSRKNPEVKTGELTVTITARTSDSKDVWIGKTRNLSLNKSINSYFKYKTEDENIATVDVQGIVTGKSAGTTNLVITSDRYPDFEMTWKLNVQEDPTGFYYNDKKLGNTLDWDAKDGTSIQFKVIDGTVFPKQELTKKGQLAYYDSTNQDVAEPVYYKGTVDMATAESWHQGTGEFKLKKNGTTTIYVYSNVNRTGYYVDKITLHVTGFDETSNLEEGWKDVSDPQGITKLKFQLLDRKVQTQSYDMSKYDNRIVEPVKADPNFTFTLKLSKETNVKDFESDNVREAYTQALLNLIEIHEVNDDGTLGKVIASNGNGYKLLKGFKSNPCDPIQIQVDGKSFQKNKTYALVAGARVTINYNTKSTDGSFSALRLYETLANDAIWKFAVDPVKAAVTKPTAPKSKVTVSTPKSLSVKKASSKRVKVSWKKVSSASGYQVYRAKSKNGKYKKVATIKATKSSRPYAKIKTPKRKKYYYKVRAYKKVGKKVVYSKYSVKKAYKLK